MCRNNMSKLTTDKLVVPVELIRFAVANRMEKALGIYLFLKFHFTGKAMIDDKILHQAGTILQMADKRTFNKHLNKLQACRLLGHNKRSGLYFVRGFDRWRAETGSKSRQGVEMYYRDLKKLTAFCVATILSAEVNKQKFIKKVVITHRLKPAANSRDAASPADVCASHTSINYFGLGLTTIARLLNCKKTRASQLRKLAADAGYIKVRHHFVPLKTAKAADGNLRNIINDIDPKLRGRIRKSYITVHKVAVPIFLIQTHDEIVPRLKFKSVNKYSNLSLSPHMRVFLGRNNSKPAA